MDVLIGGKIANRRIATTTKLANAARAHIVKKYGRVEIVSMAHLDGVVLYWRVG